MYNEYFFVLDALRADHLKYMPWLNSKINQGIYSDNYKFQRDSVKEWKFLQVKNH